jgi:O-antigen/teichoic acid export membrane protein
MPKIKFSDLRNKYFLALSGNGMLAVLGIVIMGLLLRSLDKTDVGIWFFFLNLYALGDAIRNGFLQTATIKFYSGTTPERAQNVLGSVWYLAILITGSVMLVDLVAMAFVSYISSNVIVVSIQWLGVTFISSLPFTIVFWILLAEEKYGKILLLRLVNSGSMILYIIVLMLLHKMTLQSLLWCNFLTNCLTSLVGIITGLSRFQYITKRTKACVNEIIQFGKYGFGSSLVSKLLSNTDTFLITFLLGPAALAIYNIPLRLMEIIEIPLRTFVSTAMSEMAALGSQENKQNIVRILNKYAGMLTVIFIPLTILALLFANLAIYLLAGHKYMGTEAANIYRMFMVLALFYPVDRFSGLTLDMLHQPKINFHKVMVMLAACIIGDVAGVAIFHNIYGIAAGSYLTVLCGLAFAYLQLNRFIKFSFRDILTTGYAECRHLVQKALRKQPV